MDTISFSFSIDPSAWTLISLSFLAGWTLRAFSDWWLPSWLLDWADRLRVRYGLPPRQ